MQLIDFSSSFNTADWKTKHSWLDCATIGNWILDSLTSRPERVQTGSHTAYGVE